MHGRPRKPLKPEEAAVSVARAEKLRSLQTQFLANHHKKIYTKEALELSAKLLETNPESYTAWNYRKLAVEHNLCQSCSDHDVVKSILDEELRVVENALRQNFKSYGAWHHRKWVLSKGQSSTDNELRLLGKLQKADARNFHAWNYRRFVAALMNRSEEDELKYTEDMINNNFSNYSAWHNRSVLLSSLLGRDVDRFLPDKILPEEYELVHQAIFTDPEDQSGWFYHLWLLDQTVNTKSPILISSWPADGCDLDLSGTKKDGSALAFSGFLSDAETIPLILYFNQPVLGISASTVAVEAGLNNHENLVWKPLSAAGSQSSHVWVAHFNFLKLKSDSTNAHGIKISLGHAPGIISSRGSQLSHPFEINFRVYANSTDQAEALETQIISWEDENLRSWGALSQELGSLATFMQLRVTTKKEQSQSEWRRLAIVKEIECFRELLSLVDSKIGKLTLARLLTALDAITLGESEKTDPRVEILQLYIDLMKLDPPHCHYYEDEHSVALLRQMTSRIENLAGHCFCFKDSGVPIGVKLNNLSLSRMGSLEKLLWVQILDLSHNNIRTTEGLEAMQLLSCLNISHNRLRSFSALESLRLLKHLKSLDISHNEIGEQLIDTTRYLCASPLSHSAGDAVLPDSDFVMKYWDAFFVLGGMNLKKLNISENTVADEELDSFVMKIMPSLVWLDGQKVR